uniref:Uncharacterized protein n=1 Tax=Anguilla anguilla TaxID=7936 RepID=A0A0E9RP93_ANGAN
MNVHINILRGDCSTDLPISSGPGIAGLMMMVKSQRTTH